MAKGLQTDGKSFPGKHGKSGNPATVFEYDYAIYEDEERFLEVFKKRQEDQIAAVVAECSQQEEEKAKRFSDKMFELSQERELEISSLRTQLLSKCQKKWNLKSWRKKMFGSNKVHPMRAQDPSLMQIYGLPALRLENQKISKSNKKLERDFKIFSAEINDKYEQSENFVRYFYDDEIGNLHEEQKKKISEIKEKKYFYSDRTLSKKAKELAAPETAFISKISVASDDEAMHYQISWFAKNGDKMGLCGHATLAAAKHVLAKSDEGQRVTFEYQKGKEIEKIECIKGEIDKDGDFDVQMFFPENEIKENHLQDCHKEKLAEIFAYFGIELSHIKTDFCPLQKKYILSLRAEDFTRFKPQAKTFELVKQLEDIGGIYVIAEQEFHALETAADKVMHAMQLSPARGNDIDAATGASLVAYLSREEVPHNVRYEIKQWDAEQEIFSLLYGVKLEDKKIQLSGKCEILSVESPANVLSPIKTPKKPSAQSSAASSRAGSFVDGIGQVGDGEVVTPFEDEYGDGRERPLRIVPTTPSNRAETPYSPLARTLTPCSPPICASPDPSNATNMLHDNGNQSAFGRLNQLLEGSTTKARGAGKI
jgi:predicted PhzF superfamily epimerase YddE/YHI9